MILDHFIHKSLAKNLKLQKCPKLWGFSQKYKICRYTTLDQRIFFNFQILFLTPFCNLKRYFYDFWQFYKQSLTKRPKITKISKTMRFFTKVLNISIYNFGSKIQNISKYKNYWNSRSLSDWCPVLKTLK